MLRFATIGSNFVVEWFIEGGRLCPDFKLEGVYSRDMDKAKSLAQEWGAARAYDSLESLASCPHIDAVYIASPNALHAAQIEQLLEGGKHVLCEKPVVTSLDTFNRLMALAKSKKLVLMEAMRPVHAPSMRAIRRAAGRIGMLRRAVLGFCQYSSRYDKYKKGVIENAFNPALQNGALTDIGVYCIASMVLLFGSPNEVTARGWFLPGSIDAAGSILAEYSGGLQAQLSYSKVNNSFLPCEIQGELGCIQFSPLPVPNKAEIIWNDGRREAIEFEAAEHDMQYEIAEFIQLVQSKSSYELYTTLTRGALGVMDNARRQIGIEFARVLL